MQITVKLFANFRLGRFIVAQREVAPGSTIAEMVAKLQIEPDEIGMIFVHGRPAELDQALAEGDVLALFPRVGGG